MSKSIYRQGVYGRLYDIAGADESFRRGYVNSVSLSKRLEIAEPKDMTDLVIYASEKDDPELDSVIDMLGTDGVMSYSYCADRFSIGFEAYYSYTLESTYSQPLRSLSANLAEQISPAALKKICRQRFRNVTASATQTYYLSTHKPEVILYTESYAINRGKKPLFSRDSDVFTSRGSEGMSYVVPESECHDGQWLFIPSEIPHEQIKPRRIKDQIENELAFRAVIASTADEYGEYVPTLEELSDRVNKLLDAMQGKVIV